MVEGHKLDRGSISFLCGGIIPIHVTICATYYLYVTSIKLSVITY